MVRIETPVEGWQSLAIPAGTPSRLLESRADLHDVQMFLGHAAITTTSRYLQSTPVRLERALARLESTNDGFAQDSHKQAALTGITRASVPAYAVNLGVVSNCEQFAVARFARPDSAELGLSTAQKRRRCTTRGRCLYGDATPRILATSLDRA